MRGESADFEGDDGNIYSLFRAAALRAGSRPMLVDDGGGLLRYSEMDSMTERMAQRLRDAGARPGDRIVVQVEKSMAAVILYLAALRAGVVYVPLNMAYTGEEVAYFLGDAEPAILVCDPSRRAGLQDAAKAAGVASVLTLDAAGRGGLTDDLSRGSTCPVEPRSSHDLACILYTSGTTGRSKGAMLSHGNLVSNALTLQRLWRWQEGDVLLHALPIFHVHGLFVALHGALLNGSTMLFHRRFDADAILADLPRSTVFMGVPTFYTRLLESPGLARHASSGIRLFVCGSAPLLEETFIRFRDRTGHEILERYGMTETGMITSNPYDGPRVPGTVGFALPGVSVRIAEAEGTPAPYGTAGVLEVKGPNVFQGYWKLAGKTAEDFRSDGYFITGDIATQTADGRVSIVGRAKDLIISGGFNVYPKEIELLIDAIEGIRESAVVGVPHPDFGEVVIAVAAYARDSVISEDAVMMALTGRLARFKQPKRVILVDDLPRNAMGKVQKAVLRAEYQSLFVSTGGVQ
jgi:malonyl-CoA/methylmalonyl-CoA synthetase